jgi:hypothetical protein
VGIVIDRDVIRIELSSLEKIISFHRSFKIPISQISDIPTEVIDLSHTSTLYYQYYRQGNI